LTAFQQIIDLIIRQLSDANPSDGRHGNQPNIVKDHVFRDGKSNELTVHG